MSWFFSSFATSAPPIKPVPPVIRIFLLLFETFPFLFIKTFLTELRTPRLIAFSPVFSITNLTASSKL